MPGATTSRSRSATTADRLPATRATRHSAGDRRTSRHGVNGRASLVYCSEDAVLDAIALHPPSRRSEDSRMLRKLSLVLLSFMLVAVAGSAAQAQHGRDKQGDHGRDARSDYGGKWVLLGERHIDGRVDKDKIDIGRDNGRYRAIQFRVDGGTVMFDRIRVEYLNGETDDISVRSQIEEWRKTSHRPAGQPARDRERLDVVQQAHLALASNSASVRHSLARDGSRHARRTTTRIPHRRARCGIVHRAGRIAIEAALGIVCAARPRDRSPAAPAAAPARARPFALPFSRAARSALLWPRNLEHPCRFRLPSFDVGVDPREPARAATVAARSFENRSNDDEVR